MKYPKLYTILISIAVTLVTFFLSYNYFPLGEQIVSLKGDLLGTALTTIQATDTIKNSRTTINDNFTALNNGKIEISTTSLPLITTLSGLTTAGSLATVGTITSGTWNGSTIAVGRGGTGATSFTAYGLLMGNGSSALSVVGTGISGQFLTYSTSSAPYWSSPSVDTAIAYSWTGTHTFSATSTFTGTTIVSKVPTDSNDVVNKTYFESNRTLIASTTNATVQYSSAEELIEGNPNTKSFTILIPGRVNITFQTKQDTLDDGTDSCTITGASTFNSGTFNTGCNIGLTYGTTTVSDLWLVPGTYSLNTSNTNRTDYLKNLFINFSAVPITSYIK